VLSLRAADKGGVATLTKNQRPLTNYSFVFRPSVQPKAPKTCYPEIMYLKNSIQSVCDERPSQRIGEAEASCHFAPPKGMGVQKTPSCKKKTPTAAATFAIFAV
jgi:hypothetical protein